MSDWIQEECGRVDLGDKRLNVQYSTHRSLQAVGNLGERGRKGFWAHSQYILSAEAIPLGVWHCKFTIPAVENPTVEKLQFEQVERLMRCICVYMIIAWRIHFLTKLGRNCPELPCSIVFEEVEWKPVVYILKGPEALHKEPSLGEFNQMVGQLGGHLNRKRDGFPGPQAMWRGMERVRQCK